MHFSKHKKILYTKLKTTKMCFGYFQPKHAGKLKTRKTAASPLLNSLLSLFSILFSSTEHHQPANEIAALLIAAIRPPPATIAWNQPIPIAIVRPQLLLSFILRPLLLFILQPSLRLSSSSHCGHSSSTITTPFILQPLPHDGGRTQTVIWVLRCSPF